ncbi:tRNA 5-methoxyuridine(34)/uridine 5-oxyacetic acid(34) synthase CmoB [Celerinatantimonas diazotrophica]|uniref:tRNA U34 carboxymethyltransferase n=1 Tax=Celerinatantimonas diazotrophica TaxID=412034 RepID=A0A4R1JBG0_9GAMM|nr:tRNA 5-methoxyuridine(34)/uridine 5-oxyacetic acid(34) synthase CmoB [Celerinatantimonas diazotrophica]TCK47479.1 tRNA (mo5U34)-methyltransferase [Celerinatantimonas diazotrophica]CAG9296903.1 tRNA U34 carboxymethyltransferase [Celerinatantimonas diazotrophica]
MIEFGNFYAQIAKKSLASWLEVLPKQLKVWRDEQAHGLLPNWEKVLAKLPDQSGAKIDLTNGVTIEAKEGLAEGQIRKVENLLRSYHPWRKGPYRIFDFDIDTEWRSDWKWDRLAQHISPLKYRQVLDVGCGNGYHMWRMLGADAEFVVGIDPSSLFLAQFEAIRQLAGNPQNIHLLPLGIEQLPPLQAFDTVFSMGVLYHRRSPIEHIFQLKDQLVHGGELILETLVVEGNKDTVLTPQGRYAKMNNVWFLPSVDLLALWLEKCGLEQVRCVDVTVTSVQEQRRTQWMTNESLEQFLDPNDPSRTIEGLPAPKRAVMIARKPSANDDD